MAKLTDSEYAERGRAANRRRTERYQQRLSAAGKTALTVWIPETLKTALAAAAIDNGSTIADTAAQWLMRSATALSTPNPVARPASNDSTVDLFSEPGEAEPTDTKENISDGDIFFSVSVADKAALMTEVDKLLDEGLSGGEIARRLNASGHRTANGSEFSGANLLRDYRRYQAKQSQ